jgi:hypothetical protein
MEIANSLTQNIAIADAKRYAQNHIFFQSNTLSFNAISTDLDRLIIFSIKSGQSIGITKHAIDEYLTKLIHNPVENSAQSFS